MVSYFFVIAIVNLAAGALLAMYASRRARAMVEAAAALLKPPEAEEDAGVDDAQAEQTIAAEEEPDEPEPPQPEEPEPADETAEPETPVMEPSSEETIASLLDGIEAIDKKPEPESDEEPEEEPVGAEKDSEPEPEPEEEPVTAEKEPEPEPEPKKEPVAAEEEPEPEPEEEPVAAEKEPDPKPEPEDLGPPTASEETIAALLDDVEAAISEASGETQSPARAAVKTLKNDVCQFLDKLGEHDNQLRDEATSQSPKKVDACLKDLRETNDNQLATLEQTKQSLEASGSESDACRNLLDDLFATVEKQIDQIQQANEVSEQFDYEGNLVDGCQQMVDVTTKLLSANHQTRDTVDNAMADLARSEGQLGSADSLARVDAATGVMDRIGLEAYLRELWEEDPHRQNRLAIGMLDLDSFSKVNEQFGQATGDRVLRAFANMLESESGDNTKVARMAGQRFAILMPEADIRTVTEEVELLRQTAAVMKYMTGDEEITLTVSCAVMEADEDDTSDSLFSRCDTTLQEAKTFGRNRTFSHQGEYPTPVVPSNVSAEEQLISV